jgi:hypothetical protein
VVNTPPLPEASVWEPEVRKLEGRWHGAESRLGGCPGLRLLHRVMEGAWLTAWLNSQKADSKRCCPPGTTLVPF